MEFLVGDAGAAEGLFVGFGGGGGAAVEEGGWGGEGGALIVVSGFVGGGVFDLHSGGGFSGGFCIGRAFGEGYIAWYYSGGMSICIDESKFQGAEFALKKPIIWAGIRVQKMSNYLLH